MGVIAKIEKLKMKNWMFHGLKMMFHGPKFRNEFSLVFRMLRKWNTSCSKSGNLYFWCYRFLDFQKSRSDDADPG